MTPALTSKALERVGVPLVGCAFLRIISPLVVLSLVATYCSSCPAAGRCAVAQGRLSKTGLAIMGAGVAKSTPVCLSLLQPLCLGLFGALAGLLPCPALVRVAIMQSGVPTLWYSPKGQWLWWPSLLLFPKLLCFHFPPCMQQPSTENKRPQGCCRDT